MKMEYDKTCQVSTNWSKRTVDVTLITPGGVSLTMSMSADTALYFAEQIRRATRPLEEAAAAETSKPTESPKP